MKSWIPLIAALGFGACAHQNPLPADRLAATAAATGAAEQAGANQSPAAARHLSLAKQQLEQAQKLAAAGREADHADRLLLRAKADADLAIALATAKRTQDQADQVATRARESAPREPGQAPAADDSENRED